MKKCYKFSTWGKIGNTLKVTIFFGLIGAGLVSLGQKIIYLRYIVWIPLIWIIFKVFCIVIHFWTTTFETDGEGLTIRGIPKAGTTRVEWKDIKRIKKSKNSADIRIFVKGEKSSWLLDNTIEKYKELVETVLANAKDAKYEERAPYKNSKIFLVIAWAFTALVFTGIIIGLLF